MSDGFDSSCWQFNYIIDEFGEYIVKSISLSPISFTFWFISKCHMDTHVRETNEKRRECLNHFRNCELIQPHNSLTNQQKRELSPKRR